MPAPGNDLRTNATLLSGTSGTQSGTTVDCVADADSGGVYAGWYDVWYYWSSFAAGRVRLMLDTASAAYTEAVLYARAHTSAADAGNAGFLGGAFTSDGNPKAQEMDHPGGELTLVVAVENAPDEAAFTVTWESPSTPANDTRAGAQVVTGTTGGTVTGTTKGAHAEVGTVYGSVLEVWFDVWYRWSSLPAGLLTVTLTTTDTATTEVSLWAQDPSAAAEDYGSPRFLGSDNTSPWTLTVDHPGGALTMAVATFGTDSTDFSFDWSLVGGASAHMAGSSTQTASPVQAAGSTFIDMVGGSSQTSTSPIKGTTVRVLVTHVDGVVICELPSVIVSPISYTLNEPESWTITLLQGAPFGEVLIHPFREVQVWRGDTILAWGPIVRWGYDQGHIVAQCKGAMWHLSRRYVGKANRKNWVYNGSFEAGLDQWGFITNPVMNAYGNVGAQADPPAAASVTYPTVEGRRAMSLQNSVAGADAYANQQFPFAVDASLSPEGETWTLKGYVYLDTAISAGQGAFGNRGLYLERFSTTQLNPDPQVQAVLPGAMLSLEVQTHQLDEQTPVGAWQRFEVQFTVPPKGGEAEVIDVRLYAPTTPVYWDAISLTRIEQLAFYNTDQAQIVEGLIRHAQDPLYDKSDVNISTACPPSGVLRTKKYVHSEHPPIWSSLQEFNTFDDGLDFTMVYTATERIFTTQYPRGGTYKSNYPVRLPQWDPALPGNVAEWTVSFDGEQAASSTIVLGSGSGSDREEGGAVDTSNWSDNVTMERVSTAQDGTSIDSLQNVALEQLRIGRNPLTIDVTLFHAEASGLPDLIGNVYPGDDIPVTLQRHHLDVDDVYRVIKTEISLDSGVMKLTLQPTIPT